MCAGKVRRQLYLAGFVGDCTFSGTLMGALRKNGPIMPYRLVQKEDTLYVFASGRDKLERTVGDDA